MKEYAYRFTAVARIGTGTIDRETPALASWTTQCHAKGEREEGVVVAT